ncbi:MAG: ABC transporter substrate-binding protein [Hylemonella sp.]|jgi:NitT/TauT family transport system substrate-binding protein|uniref:ABC transporter substrate-binding protein n=1 Tax=Hylemonella sp. TaxID=2066020 RepID=UPI0039191A76
MKRHTLRALLALAALSLLGATASAQDAKLEKITIASWGGPISEVTNLLVEPDKGFFRARGIELVYMPGTGGGDAVRNLLSGQADVAFTDPGSFYAALDKGEKLRAIYDIYPQNVFNVVSLKSANIRKPADLKGKKIGVYSLSSGTLANLQLLLNQAGLSTKDVTIVVTGLLNFAPLMQGQVDATAATDTGLLVARARGVGEVNVMEVRDSLNLSSDLFVVREETYQKRKDVLKRFLAAYRDSAQWMMDQPEEAAKLAVKRAINGQNEAVNLEVIKLRNATSVSPLTQKNGLGAINVDMLQKGAVAWKQIGLIERDLDMKAVVSQDLLPGKK